jgi:hypothetical protein
MDNGYRVADNESGVIYAAELELVPILLSFAKKS